MKNRYHVKKVLGGYALMDGDNQLYITTQKIARNDAAQFNKAAQHSVQRTATFAPPCTNCGDYHDPAEACEGVTQPRR